MVITRNDGFQFMTILKEAFQEQVFLKTLAAFATLLLINS